VSDVNDSGGKDNPSWSSGFTFILAAVGSAVGLGNIWKFPYVAGMNGGGAFLIVYVLSLIFVVAPILLGELMIGRLGHPGPPIAMRRVARRFNLSTRWAALGWLGMLIGFLVATFYCVVAGWTLAYVVEAWRGFGGERSSEEVFGNLLASPGRMIFWQSIFLLATLWIVKGGLNQGIERAVRFLMPALFLMLLLMIGYAAVEGDFRAGLDFLFSTDFSRIDGSVVLAATGQAFFSIGVGVGVMMAYGAYVPQSVSLGRSVLIIVGADTLVAVLAGLMIFPIVFANDLDPAQGPGLVFVTMPTAFAQMPGGVIFGMLFFLLLAVAAITSVIAGTEPAVAYMQERWGWTRGICCMVFGLLAWVLGLVTVFSFNIWADFTPLDSFKVFAGKTLFDLLDYIVINIMTPISGILIALFVGWKINPEFLSNDLKLGHPWVLACWLFLLRFVVPVVVLAILIQGLS